jgi:hypothetical protein
MIETASDLFDTRARPSNEVAGPNDALRARRASPPPTEKTRHLRRSLC